MSTVELVIADDHGVVRGVLISYLEKHGFTITGEASDGAEAVRVVRRVKPQIVIMDLSMPVMNGIDAAEQIRQEFGTQVILLSMYCEPHQIRRAFESGVAAYVLKAKSGSELLVAISEVRAGNTYLSPGISAAVLRQMLNKGSHPGEILTFRERQVLQLVVEGKSTKELANLLSISVRTGESHRSRIMEKLRIYETAGLVRYAVREGILEP
jgi:DNA-binding NarL/FixJ family response regulator